MCNQKRNWIRILFFIVVSCFWALDGYSQTDSLQILWQANTEDDLAGYKIYYGTASGNYTTVIDAGNLALYNINKLSSGINYYFAVTAYDTAGNESGFSSEVVGFIPVGDYEPPKIVQTTILDLTHVDILFSEKISQATAENAQNYQISDGVQVAGVSLDSDSQTVHLTTGEHQYDHQYTITVNGIQDLAAIPNTIAANSKAHYLLSQTDTTAPTISGVKLLTNKFLEISFNEPLTKESVENKSNYFISDGVQVLASRIKADSKSVLLETTEHAENQTYTITINNIQDRAVPPNTIADNSTAEYSIEGLKGEPPAIASIEKHSLTKVEVLFTKQITKVSAENIANYSVNNNVQVLHATLRASETSVLLLTSEHQRNVQYTITINNIQDKETPANIIPPNSTADYFFEITDDEPPVIETVTTVDPRNVVVIFSEQITRESAEEITNYRINNGIEIISAQLRDNLKAVHLTTSTHQADVNYTIAINNIQDRSTPPNTIPENSTATYKFESLDVTLPTLVSAEILSETKVDLVFSESIAQVAAEIVQNYSIDKGIEVTRATLDQNLKVVHLLTSVHERGNTYSVTVNNITDRASTPNKIARDSKASYYFKIVDMTPPALSGLQINNETEIEISFSEALDKNTAENKANYSIDKGIEINKATLDENEMLVRLTTTPHERGEIYTITMNNLVDLAPIPNKIKTNTAYSYSLPLVDNVSPLVIAVNVVSETGIQVTFSESVEGESAELITNYKVNKGIEIYSAKLLNDQKTVELQTNEHQRGVTYLLSVSGIKDLAPVPNVIIANSTKSYIFRNVDTIGPEVIAVIPHSETELEVLFSEQISLETAELAQNYRVNKGVNVLSVSLSNDLQGVYLTTSPHARGMVYTIQFSGIEDIGESHNSLTGNTVRTYFLEIEDTSPPVVDSVRIWTDDRVVVYFNEKIDRGSAENPENYYIDQNIQVEKAKLGKNQRHVTLTTSRHERGLSYRVSVSGILDLAPNPNEIASNTNYLYFFESVDTTPPTIVSTRLVNSNLLEIVFSEPIERSSAELVSNYAISRDAGIEVLTASLDESENTVLLKTIRHQHEGRYFITLSNIYDKAPIPNQIKENSYYSYLVRISSVLKNISLNYYQLDSLSVGNSYYIDRGYMLMNVPDDKEKLLWLKTANSDRWRTDDDFLSFQVETNVKIYIGYDSRALTVPYWLEENFKKTNKAVGVSDLSHEFEIWEQTCASGKVVLGGNMASGANGAKAMYVVMFEKSTVDEASNISGDDVPVSFKLYQNYPNPFNGGTQIRFDLPERSRVKLIIYNILGQEVKVLQENVFQAGQYNVGWDGKNEYDAQVANGLYFASLQVRPYDIASGQSRLEQTFQEVKKLTYLK